MIITNAFAPTVPAEITDLMDDLTGFDPALDSALAAIGDLLTADLTPDRRQSLVAAIGGFEGGNVMTLLAMTVRQLATPDAPPLNSLPKARKQDLRRLGAEYAAAINDSGAQQIASEISGVIDGS